MIIPEIIVLGHHGVGQIIRVHAFPKPGETIISLGQLELLDSGKGGNQAICLGLLKCSVCFIGKIGDDKHGHLGEKWMRERGVDTSGIIFSKELSTSRGLIFIDDQGQNTIINGYRPENYLTYSDIEGLIQERAKAKYFLTGFEIPLNVALKSTKLAKELGMFTIVNPGPAPLHEIGDLSFVDVLIPNETEARTIARIPEGEKLSNFEIVNTLKEHCKSQAIVMTLGSQGLCGIDSNNINWSYPALKTKVVDTLGAGDAFVGGFIWGLTENKSLFEASQYGNIVASLSVQKQGSFPSYPTKKEVLEKKIT